MAQNAGKTGAQKKSAPQKKAKTASAKTGKPAKPAPARKASAPAKSKAASAGRCRNVKVKTAQGTRTKRVCSTPAAAALTSPITANALERPATDKQPEFKARSAPERAYAVDGTSFFHQGRKFRVQGLDDMPGELATQRLQMALDSGALTLEPVAVDDTGVMTAVVRVGGRDIAETLRVH